LALIAGGRLTRAGLAGFLHPTRGLLVGVSELCRAIVDILEASIGEARRELPA
jgi:hypothetical protein